MKCVNNKLRIYHMPQVPCKPFYVEVANEHEAKLVLDALINQHIFLFEENMIPDYSNVVGVEMFEGEVEGVENNDGWTDYYNEEEFMDWEEFVEAYLN